MIIDTADKLAGLYRALDRTAVVALDTETTGLKWTSRAAGLVLATQEGKRVHPFYVPVRHETSEPQLPPTVLREITAHLTGKLVVTQNGKFDAKILLHDDAWPKQGDIVWHELQQLIYCLQSDRFSYALDNMAWDWIGYRSGIKDWASAEAKARHYDLETKGFSQFPISDPGWQAYVENDGFMTIGTHDAAYARLTDPAAPWWGGPDLVAVYEEDMKLLWALLRMEVNGLHIDVPRLQAAAVKLTAKVAAYQAEMDALAGKSINFNSGKQLRELFQSKGWPLPYDTAEMRVSFADVVLRNLKYDGADAEQLKRFAWLVYTSRSAEKMKTSYLENFMRHTDPEGFIHPDFWAHGTVTGRLSCHNPAMQTIPKRYVWSSESIVKSLDDLVQNEVREVFIPRSPEYRFVELDYANQEMRLFVHYSDDPGMRKIFEEGGDIHRHNAILMLGADSEPKEHKSDAWARWRAIAKAISFGVLYSMGIKKLGETIGVSRDQAKIYFDAYMRAFPTVRVFMNRITEVADQRGYIRTAFNRRVRFRRITDAERAAGKIKISKGWMQIWGNMQNYVTHKALNHLIQGGCADQARQAVIRVDALLAGRKSVLVNQIHDSLLLELHESEYDELLPQIIAAMEDWQGKFTVPFPTERKIGKPGENWGVMGL